MNAAESLLGYRSPALGGHGDRGRSLGAYVLFTTLAVAVLITNALRV